MNIPINQHCRQCNVPLDQANWPSYEVIAMRRICRPCHTANKKSDNEIRAVIQTESGAFKHCGHRNKKPLLNKNPGSIYVGKFDRRAVSLDDFVKSLGFGGVAQVQAEVIKNKYKKFKTAEQYARSIERRVLNTNSDRILKRYAREKKILANLRNPDGTLYDWFVAMYDATHCSKTGLEFQADGPFQKSVDQIIAGDNYEEGNIQVVCLMYNYAKNKFTDADVEKMCISMYEKIKGL